MNKTPLIAIALKNDFNSKHVSKVQDVLNRLQLEDLYFEYNQSTEDLIKGKANLLINSFDKIKLAKQIKKEAGTYNYFKEVLDKIVK